MERQSMFYRNKYGISFYAEDDDTLVVCFDNLQQICKYKGLPITSKNINTIEIGLYRALKREDHFTELLGEPMHVYLIDINEDE